MLYFNKRFQEHMIWNEKLFHFKDDFLEEKSIFSEMTKDR